MLFLQNNLFSSECTVTSIKLAERILMLIYLEENNFSGKKIENFGKRIFHRAGQLIFGFNYAL